MPLMIHLVLRLVGVALLCLCVTIGWIVMEARSGIEADTAASAERVASRLENLYWRELLWRGSLHKKLILPVPEWDTIETVEVLAPGVCVTFAPGSAEPRRLCSQLEGVGAPAPRWFAALFETWFGAPPAAARFLTIRQQDAGVVRAKADPTAAVRQAWRQVSIVVRVAALMVLGVCLLGALAIGHLLAPARAIVAGLRGLEEGDYGLRLPLCKTAEFGHIARAVNDLAARLAQTTAERVALTKRLFEVQEEERRALARDLHDEFGQCLTATMAFAAAIEAGAGADRPDLAQDARSIAAVAKRMMTTLREALARLRSQELEELGLAASLAQLVAGWNARRAPTPLFHLDLAGDIGGLPPAVAVSVYRVAQECLTNAARHGRPSRVDLRVERRDENGGAVALTVEDDGGGDAAQINAAAGHGVLGMRERVAASGGRLSIMRAARGVRVAAVIPLPTAAMKRRREASAA